MKCSRVVAWALLVALGILLATALVHLLTFGLEMLLGRISAALVAAVTA